MSISIPFLMSNEPEEIFKEYKAIPSSEKRKITISLPLEDAKNLEKMAYDDFGMDQAARALEVSRLIRIEKDKRNNKD